MVVIKYRLALLIWIMGCIGCSEKDEQSDHLLDQTLFPSFKHEKPIAAIVNLPIMSKKDALFTLSEDSRVRVCAVGEADFNWVSGPKEYLFKGDAIEFYIKTETPPFNQPVIIPLFQSNEKLDQNLEHRVSDAVFNVYYDTNARRYRVTAMIPWQSLSIKPSKDKVIGFNLAIGDNDDKLKQKARLVLFGDQDPVLQDTIKYGAIFLTDLYKGNYGNDVLPSVFKNDFNPKKDTISNNHTPVEHLVFGQVNQPEDFSATIESFWDSEHLYLQVGIRDNATRKVDLNEIRQASAFFDWGSIEDEKGQVIWKMQNFFAEHAGGALKNQMLDTVIQLQAGRYKLNYHTDESHSWGNWDDRPPNTPFYGIAVYLLSKQ